ncbi:hypothetical protein ABZP36_007931 [Zizania latifolia]
MAVLLRPAAIAGGRQVWPVAEDHQPQEDAEAVSQRLVEAVARGDAREAGELLASGRADVNYAGVVWLKARRVAEASLRDGAAAELRAAHEEIRADVSPLFLAAGNGDAALVRALLVSAPPSPSPAPALFYMFAALPFVRCIYDALHWCGLNAQPFHRRYGLGLAHFLNEFSSIFPAAFESVDIFRDIFEWP